MRVGFFRAFGVLTLLLSPCAFSGRGSDFGAFVLFAAVVVIGVGLIYLRKWAAIYFSVSLFGYGLWMALRGIQEVEFPFNLLVMAYGVSQMLPLFVTIRIWPHLTWRGKWFF